MSDTDEPSYEGGIAHAFNSYYKDQIDILLEEVERLRGVNADYRRFHAWVSKVNYDLIAEWDEMESEEE
jgi:hypothetical protein